VARWEIGSEASNGRFFQQSRWAPARDNDATHICLVYYCRPRAGRWPAMPCWMGALYPPRVLLAGPRRINPEGQPGTSPLDIQCVLRRVSFG
jgi:hypothetical protein